jgi:glycosyltransferase involved in cell wall biosynthesis
MISVLLPTYNSERTVAPAINSILGQTYQDYELLVLDDGSSDNTVACVNKISDSRIRVIRLDHQGLAGTLNVGLSAARFNIIARMDADDLSSPVRFEKQLCLLEKLPENVLISCWYAIFSDDSILYTISTPTESDDIKKGLLLHSYISHPGLMFRKDVLVRCGGYTTSNAEKAFEDYETWLAIKDKVEFAIVSEVLVYQRYRKESLSNNLAYKKKIMYAIQEPYYEDLKNTFNIIDTSEENIYRGWREYFYGDPAKARKYWRATTIRIVRYPKLLLAYCFTFLPETLLILVKEARVRLRLKYFLSYYTSMHSAIRREFRTLNGSNENPHRL